MVFPPVQSQLLKIATIICVLSVFVSASHSQNLSGLQLRRRAASHVSPSLVPGILPREIVRQAILMAAREELNLWTRDASLREPFLDNGLELDVKADVLIDGRARIEVYGSNGETVLEKVYTVDPAVEEVYHSLVTQLEADSRSALVDMLKGQGLARGEVETPDDAVANVGVADIEAELLKMDVVSQFRVLQTLLKRLRVDNNDKALLSQVARGYANLSFLTAHQWSSMSEVFAARALLYGERLAFTNGDGLAVATTRAYVCALLGFHAVAMKHLEKVDGEMPRWLSPIPSYCRYSKDGLLNSGKNDRTVRQLVVALLSRVVTASRIEKDFELLTRGTIRNAPKYLPVYHDFLRGALGYSRLAADRGPLAIPGALVAPMHDFPELPKSVKDRDTQDATHPYQDAATIGGLLVQASSFEDSRDLSWAILGRLIEEEVFGMVVVEFTDAINAVESSHSQLAQDRLRFIGDHPFKSTIESFVGADPPDLQRLVDTIGGVSFVDTRPHMSLFFHRSWRVSNGPGTFVGLSEMKQAAREYTAHQSGRFMWADESVRPPLSQLAVELQRISPHYPPGFRAYINSFDEPTTEQLAEWEERAAQDPIALACLGAAYARVDDDKAAERSYRRAIEIAPVSDAYFSLASLHYRHKKYDQWKSVLEEFLAEPSFGLSHAAANMRLANGLMQLQRWKEARPYAEEAAQSYSGGAMACFAYCLEGLKELEESELWAKRLSESYPSGSGDFWHVWRRRNGLADDPKAVALARRSGSDYEDQILMGLMDRQHIRVANILRTNQMAGFQRDLCFACVAHFAEDSDQLLRAKNILGVWEHWKDATPREKAVAKVMRQALDETPKAPSDAEVAIIFAEEISSDALADFRYFVGEAYAIAGNTEKARELWGKVLETGPYDRISSTMAGFRLSQLPAK